MASESYRAKAKMNSSDLWCVIVAHLDNETIRKLSQLSLWNTISHSLKKQLFWKLRTENLVGQELRGGYELSQAEVCWKRAFYILSDYAQGRMLFYVGSMPDELTVSIALETRHDLSRWATSTIRNAAQHNAIGVMKLLLQDGRVDPDHGIETPLMLACGHGSIEVAKLLLQDERCDPRTCDSLILTYTVTLGTVEALQLLLEDGRADPTSSYNSKIVIAAINRGSVDMVRALLVDGRIDWRKSRHEYERYAITKKNEEILDLFLDMK